VLWFAKPDGTYWTVEGGLEPGNLADRPYFPRLLAGQRVLGDLVVSKSTGWSVAIAAVPVLGPDGTVTGILGSSIPLESLSDRIRQEMDLDDRMIFYSFDATPLLALVWDPDLILADPMQLGEDVAEAFLEMLAHEEGTVTYTFQGKRRTVIYRRSPVTQWWYAFGVLQDNPPVLTVPAKVETVAGTPVTFTATAIDPDGGPLAFSLSGAPAGAAIDAATGVFTWRPMAPGEFTFDVTVTDGGGLSDTESVTVDVGPAISVGRATAATKGRRVIVQVPLTNRSATPAASVTLTTATLAGVPANGALRIGTVRPGATVTCTLSFKALPSGGARLVLEGTSSLGVFSRTQLVQAP